MLVAAMIPIATGQGSGASARASMAKVILGGQALSLFLSLLITPIAYSLWDDIAALPRRFFALFRRRPKAAPPEPPADETVPDGMVPIPVTSDRAP
jgi:HAE1 family hydrophobic/amphiphilic exporter-1